MSDRERNSLIRGLPFSQLKVYIDLYETVSEKGKHIIVYVCYDEGWGYQKLVANWLSIMK